MHIFQIIYLSFHVYIHSLVTATKNEMHHILPPATFKAKKKKLKKKSQLFCIKSVITISSRSLWLSTLCLPCLASQGPVCVCTDATHRESEGKGAEYNPLGHSTTVKQG